MASSSASESGQLMTNAPRLCYCGERSPVKISMTSGNMGRRFYSYARYGVDVTCDYFEWVDPPHVPTWEGGVAKDDCKDEQVGEGTCRKS
ncbi:hypothetical protein LOK49_LG03G00272 [Camellia lanceoleosa]|uniref:Uncharacterized protein n=1 Tax=Camellia lanceoleosa TaxID=1840588 RepID=A0ACC0IAX2_9ERIC|nr:hypothetical protein LOK49_LG03G00272 [Camellia lanceoleosa]